MSYKLAYDKLVRKRCHEKRLMSMIPFGSPQYLRVYGRSAPVNGGVLAQTLARGLRVSDIEKEHGHFLLKELQTANSLPRRASSPFLLGRRGSSFGSDDPNVNAGRGGRHPRAEETDDDIDPWGEYEADTGISREQYFEFQGMSSTPVPQMEGVHSPSHATTRLELTLPRFQSIEKVKTA